MCRMWHFINRFVTFLVSCFSLLAVEKFSWLFAFAEQINHLVRWSQTLSRLVNYIFLITNIPKLLGLRPQFIIHILLEFLRNFDCRCFWGFVLSLAIHNFRLLRTQNFYSEADMRLEFSIKLSSIILAEAKAAKTIFVEQKHSMTNDGEQRKLTWDDFLSGFDK